MTPASQHPSSRRRTLERRLATPSMSRGEPTTPPSRVISAKEFVQIKFLFLPPFFVRLVSVSTLCSRFLSLSFSAFLASSVAFQSRSCFIYSPSSFFPHPAATDCLVLNTKQARNSPFRREVPVVRVNTTPRDDQRDGREISRADSTRSNAAAEARLEFLIHGFLALGLDWLSSSKFPD